MTPSPTDSTIPPAAASAPGPILDGVSGGKDAGITLLVPCYNGAAHIPAFLASLEGLEAGFDAVLFLDDCSTDGSAALLEATGYPVIRLERNGGAAAARNRLLADSTTAYVHFHDIDDPFSRPDFLTVLRPHLDGASVVFGTTRFIELDGRVSERPAKPDLAQTAPAQFVLSDVVHLNATLWPRAVLQGFGGFRAELRTHEDIMLFIDAHAHGAPLRHVPHVVADHVKNSASTLQRIVAWQHDLQALEICRLAAQVLPACDGGLIAQKAMYHLRALASAGQAGRARAALRQMRPVLAGRRWSGGSRGEYWVSRLLGHGAALNYLAWRS